MTRRTLSLAALLAIGMVVLAAPRDEEARKYADELKASKNAKVRMTAAKELGRLGQVQRKVTEPHTAVIVAALKDPDARVRAEAARTLGLIDPADKKDAIEKVIAVLKTEKSEEARAGQEMGLGSLGGTTDDTELKRLARQALLEQRKKTESKREQKVIQAALLLITGPKKKKD